MRWIGGVCVLLFVVATNASPVGSYDDESTADKPIHDFVFIKVPKTGSSTFANVLQRYIYTHNLSMAMPPRLVTFFELTQPSHIRNFAQLQQNNLAHFNAIINHLTFTPETAAFLRRDIVPAGPHTRYFAMLRRPWEAFLSHFCFFKWARLLNEQKEKRNLHAVPPLPTKTCLEGVVAYLAELDGAFAAHTLPDQFNPQASALGLPPSERAAASNGSPTGAAATVTQALVARLDAQLDFMLLTDYFDESMVLLKRRMRWSLSDVLYLSLKQEPMPLHPRKLQQSNIAEVAAAVAATERKVSLAAATAAHVSLAQQLVELVPAASQAHVERKFLGVDMLLYAHYNASFWRMVAAEGPGFYTELAAFRALQAQFLRTCAQEEHVREALRVDVGDATAKKLPDMPNDANPTMCEVASWPCPTFSRIMERRANLGGTVASNGGPKHKPH